MTANLGVVQETMLIPLVIKANETLRQKARIRDEKAVEIMKQLQMDTEKYDKFMSHEGVVARTIMFDQALKQFLEKYPEALCPGLTLLRENSFNDVMKTYTFRGWLFGSLPKLKDCNDRLAVYRYKRRDA